MEGMGQVHGLQVTTFPESIDVDFRSERTRAANQPFCHPIYAEIPSRSNGKVLPN